MRTRSLDGVAAVHHQALSRHPGAVVGQQEHERAGDLFRWIGSGELKFKVDHVFPLAEAAKAQEELAARRTTGKVVLIP